MKLSRSAIVGGAGILASVAFLNSAHAQSADALIDKLVEKGILSVKEANELREETDKGFTSAYQVKSGMPDWVTALKFNGDLRARFDGLYSDDSSFVDRNRFRYRLRFGAVATIKDNFEVGLRLGSAERTDNFGGDPISGNTSFADNASRKFIFIDLVYAKWSPINTPNWSGSFTFGKMENPFVLSDMIFDPDYTPEGGAIQLARTFSDKHAVKLNVGGFVLDEISASSNDPYLLGAQLRFDSTWNKRVATSLGVAGLAVSGNENLLTANVPNINRGNARNAAGGLVYDYNPLVGDAAITYTFDSGPMYNAPFPIRLAGDYIYNPAADGKNFGYSGTIMFGKSGKKGLWDISYTWKYLGGDAWFEELVDSDFGAFYGAGLPNSGFGAGYGPGTNVKGHIAKVSYSPFDSLTLSAKWFLTELVTPLPGVLENKIHRLQVDAVWKF